MGIRYRAGMQYDEESVRKLDNVITDTYHIWRRIIWYVVAVAMVLYGVASGIGSVIGMLFTAAGCILLPAVRRIPSGRGNQIIQVMRGKTLSFAYEFREDRLISNAAGQDTPILYRDILKLVKDDRCYYLFQSKDQACMIDKQTLKPADAQGFEKFLQQKTGMEWSGPLSLGKMTLSALIGNKKKPGSGRIKNR